MDFQAFADSVAMPCCVLSVQCTLEHTCGEIRIVCANQPYKETMGPAYYDGMPYYELVPEDKKFEDYCFRSAILGQRMHAYVETAALNCWTDQTIIPLRSPAVPPGQFTERSAAGAAARQSASDSAQYSATRGVRTPQRPGGGQNRRR